MRLDPYNEVKGTGVLGRLSDALANGGYEVNSFAIDTDLTALTGRRSDTAKQAAESNTGFERFNPSAELGEDLRSEVLLLNRAGNLYNNFFSEIASESTVSHCAVNCNVLRQCTKTCKTNKT